MNENSPIDIVAESKIDENKLEDWLKLAKNEVDLLKKLEYYTLHLNQHPDDFEALSAKGFCQIRLGNYDQALQEADHLLRKDRTKIDGYFLKGHALFGKGRMDQAQIVFEDCFKMTG